MRKAIRLEVNLSRGATGASALSEYGRLYRVDLNVLRARVTESRAWYLLDVSGAARKVEALIRLFRERGVSMRTHHLSSSFA